MDMQEYPQIEEKAWGKKIKLAPGIDIMAMKAGHRTSWHMHKLHDNLFSVIDGRAKVVVRDIDDGRSSTQEVGPHSDACAIVWAGCWHEVVAHGDCIILESTSNIDTGLVEDFGDDIIRCPEQLGGKIDSEVSDASF